MGAVTVVPAGDLHPTAIIGPRPALGVFNKLFSDALSTNGFMNDERCDST
jgi:hypothetical protein